MKQTQTRAPVRTLLTGLLLAGLGLGGSGPALAVYKCVGADGKVTYTDSPCVGASQVSRVETPPPLTPREQAAAEDRSERLINQARVLEYRQTLEAADRQRRYEAERQAERQAEINAQRQAELELERERDRLVVVRPVPIIPRRPPPPVVPKPPRPEVPERQVQMRGYPFR
ncbi:DUF4124 domain-containing protein [Zoogloea sp.]|uniref:DUF4124 domain-containing protein n=1 Tax=Zoogloea sp. TaxID=49181 RepID=UPI0031FBD27A